MTSWGHLTMVAAIFLGLERSMGKRQRYAVACVAAEGFASLRQRTY